MTQNLDKAALDEIVEKLNSSPEYVHCGYGNSYPARGLNDDFGYHPLRGEIKFHPDFISESGHDIHFIFSEETLTPKVFQLNEEYFQLNGESSRLYKEIRQLEESNLITRLFNRRKLTKLQEEKDKVNEKKESLGKEVLPHFPHRYTGIFLDPRGEVWRGEDWKKYLLGYLDRNELEFKPKLYQYKWGRTAVFEMYYIGAKRDKRPGGYTCYALLVPNIPKNSSLIDIITNNPQILIETYKKVHPGAYPDNKWGLKIEGDIKSIPERKVLTKDLGEHCENLPY